MCIYIIYLSLSKTSLEYYIAHIQYLAFILKTTLAILPVLCWLRVANLQQLWPVHIVQSSAACFPMVPAQMLFSRACGT